MDKRDMLSIHTLFANANVSLAPNERLQFITNYIPGPPKSIMGDYIIFIFEERYFKIERKFIAMKDIGGKASDYAVIFKSYKLDFEIIEYTNCLYVPNNCNPKPQKIYRHPCFHLHNH